MYSMKLSSFIKNHGGHYGSYHSVCGLAAKGIELDEAISEELGILLSKNKESVMKIMKGGEVDGILEVESAEVVELSSAKKKK